MFDNDITVSRVTPCYMCNKHTPTCHAECFDYAIWGALHEEQREKYYNSKIGKYESEQFMINNRRKKR